MFYFVILSTFTKFALQVQHPDTSQHNINSFIQHEKKTDSHPQDSNSVFDRLSLSPLHGPADRIQDLCLYQ